MTPHNLRLDGGRGVTREQVTASLVTHQDQVRQAIAHAERRAPELRGRAHQIMAALGTGPGFAAVRDALGTFETVLRMTQRLKDRPLSADDVPSALKALDALAQAEGVLSSALDTWQQAAEETSWARQQEARAVALQQHVAPQPPPDPLDRIEQQIAAGDVKGALTGLLAEVRRLRP